MQLFREAENLGFEFRTQFHVLKAAMRFVPEQQAKSMRNFLDGISSVSPEAWWRDVVRMLKGLSYREREVFKLRYGLGDGFRYLQHEVASIFGLSQPRISQIEAKARRKFLNRMRGGDLSSGTSGDHPAELPPTGGPAAFGPST